MYMRVCSSSVTSSKCFGASKTHVKHRSSLNFYFILRNNCSLDYTQYLWIAVVDANDKFIAFAADKEGSSLNSYKSISVYLNPGTYYILVLANYEYRYLYAGEYYYFGVWFE